MILMTSEFWCSTRAVQLGAERYSETQVSSATKGLASDSKCREIPIRF